MLTVLYITMYNVKQSFSFNDTHFKLRELSIDIYTGIWSQLKSNTSAVKKQKTKKPSVQKHSFVSFSHCSVCNGHFWETSQHNWRIKVLGWAVEVLMLPVSVGSSFLEVSLVSYPAAAVAGLDPGQSFLCHGHQTHLQPENCTSFTSATITSSFK